MNPDPNLEAWIAARARHHLSHAHVQMARELGMDPRSLGKLDNHRQERWKAPLPEFIDSLYAKRFDRARPEVVRTIEQRAKDQEAKRRRKKEAKVARRAGRVGSSAPPSPPTDLGQG